MRKVSGQLLSAKPVSLSRAVKLISRFATVDNGSSATVSLYLQRTADAFNHLLQFHDKRFKNSDVGNSPDRKRPEKPLTDWVEKKPDVKAAQDSISRGKRNRKIVNGVAEANQYENGVKDLKSGDPERRKGENTKKKRTSDAVDSKEKSRSKKRRVEGLNS